MIISIPRTLLELQAHSVLVEGMIEVIWGEAYH